MMVPSNLRTTLKFIAIVPSNVKIKEKPLHSEFLLPWHFVSAAWKLNHRHITTVVTPMYSIGFQSEASSDSFQH